MDEAEGTEDGQLFPKLVGERLREARKAAGISLEDVARQTRIPQRHLETIEESDYSRLPSPTYAMGFAKAYARVVGLDEVVIGRDLRAELDQNYEREPPQIAYEVDDPARVPTGGIAMAGLVVALLLLIGAGIWYGTDWFRSDGPSATPAPVASSTPIPVPSASPVAQVPANGGQVTLTATGQVWVRIYDAHDKTLMMKTMQPGERYNVPQDADNPMINIGRPDQIDVTINGARVPPLGTADHAIKDVGVSADALRARESGTAAANP